MLTFVMTYGPAILQAVLIALGAVVAILHIIAPLTKTDRDDKAESALRKAMVYLDALLSKVLPKRR